MKSPTSNRNMPQYFSAMSAIVLVTTLLLPILAAPHADAAEAANPANPANPANATETVAKPPKSPPTTKEKNMTAYVTASDTQYAHHAKGTFEVKLAPQPAEANANAAAPGRMTIAKQFNGDLTASSEGQMLAAQTAVKGSAGYVAMERVTGTLHGLNGSFLLQHTGTMNRGAPTLSVTVVPDSGTGALTGLTGKMNIIITEGKHSYEFDYSIAVKP